MSSEKLQFKTEINQLLNLVINSLYTHREIFLRELISNASDALDKLKLESLVSDTVLENDHTFKIKIIPDKDKKTLTISDTGIGMSKDEIIENLGTIAHSNTKEFIEKLKDKNLKENIDLIGQFGVGFYSAFMVADKVEVISKRAGGKYTPVKWISKADGYFLVEEAEKSTRGTDVILYLKDDMEEFLDEWRIKELIKKYSDFIEYPIVMDVEKDSTVVKGEKVKEEEVLNSQKALWLRDKNAIKQTEYCEFYKHISHDFNDPLEIIHYKVEGQIEFTALLYIPKKRPFNIYFTDYKYGPMLYVKRVQIMENCEELLPPYLRFVKGVVETSDLPLNISRETFQNNKQIELIRKNLTNKVIDTIEKLKKQEYEKYVDFYKEFGKILKEGIHIDFGRKEKIASLLLFESTKTEKGKFTDLDTYVANMKIDQKEIFYITGESREALEKSPYLELFKEKDIEVLMMTDDIDDFIMSGLVEYKGKLLKSAIKGDLKLDENKTKEKELKGFLKYVKNNLKDKVKDVRISGRLKESPCCIVAGENDLDPKMAKIFEAMGQSIPEGEKILEINPDHKLTETLNKIYQNDKNNKELKRYIDLLYEQALILQGEKPSDPVKFVNNISDILFSNIKKDVA
jgi:molecular chaperone HtpG